MDRHTPRTPHEATPPDPDRRTDPTLDDELDENPPGHSNPPRTTTGKITSPKFGSAGSGGLELEPGPERP
jgi:hypothetical protein